MTALCRLLQITHPIIQSGMGRVAGPELAAQVSGAGALGVLAGLNVAPADLAAQIDRLRQLTDRPFGVNLWLHPDVWRPIDPDALPREDVAAVNAALRAARAAVGLPRIDQQPPSRPDYLDTAIDIIIERRVPLMSVALGLPPADVVDRCHSQGVRVMAMVTNVEDARAAAHVGIDVIVAQGAEAGGHRSAWKPGPQSTIGTFALVPEIADAVNVPVVAAGGIADGRGLIAAEALGAAGVLMGTRFVATRESTAPEFWKRAILGAGSDSTVVTAAFTGLPARVLRNRFVEDFEQSGAPALPGLHQAGLGQEIWMKAARDNNADYFPMYAGQSVGVIRDIPGAADVVASIVSEAEAVRRRFVQ